MATPRSKIRKTSPFAWDGHHLGYLDDTHIIDKTSVKIGRSMQLWQLNIDNFQTSCFVKPVDTLLPAIIDELKVLFNLPKIGTHTFRTKGKLMIAYQPLVVDHQVHIESTLDTIDQESITPVLTDQVRRLFAFREVFGIKDTHESNIAIRMNSQEDPIIISYCEAATAYADNDTLASVLPQIIHDKWFCGNTTRETFKYVVTDLFSINRECPEMTIAYYRPLIENIILRIDKSLIGYVGYFLDRLSQFLPY